MVATSSGVTPLVDFVVTRKETDPRQYTEVLFHPRVNLIEVDFVEGSVIQARKNLVLHGTAPYVAWFDPDDELYTWTMHTLIDEIVANPDLDAAFMLSDTLLPDGRQFQININKFTDEAMHSHLMRVIKRSFIEENIELFNNPVAEWAMLATLLTKNVVIIPKSGFKWIPTAAGHHKTITSDAVIQTRLVVKGILGDKYDYSKKFKQPKRRPVWQLPHPKRSAQTTSSKS